MTHLNPDTTVFALGEQSRKADPALVGPDEQHLAAVWASLDRSIAEVSRRLDAARRAPGGTGQAAMDRDQEIHRLSARLRILRRSGPDLCLGRMIPHDSADPVYVGRMGLTDSDGQQLLLDWRAPAAEPFFGATHADPMGLTSRRRYLWSGGQISDYWDEVFTADGLAGHAASLDDQSAFIASLGRSRSPRMRDVLATIQADQARIIRAGSSGALVVEGGPGTGKTVVALHRTAYLLHADPRLGRHRGRVLFVGPHRPYLAYVADVLPSLGEEGVLTCTVRDLVPEGADAAEEPDPRVAALKSTAAMVGAIEPAVGLYEEPPTVGLEVDTTYVDLWVSPEDFEEAFQAPDPGTPHNEARDDVLEALLDILVDKVEEDVPAEVLRVELAQSEELTAAVHRAWPLLEATDLVGDLWEVPAYLRRCAPWLSADEVRLLQRPDPRAWTVADLPLLDAARLRLGDPETSRRKRRHAASVAYQRQQMAEVVDHLIATDDSEMQVMSMLRLDDAQSVITAQDGPARSDSDTLAGPFAHIVVDEAQELSDGEWTMLLARCPTRSLTIVGDRAQARHGFTDSWPERLARIGLDAVDVASLNVNYRTPLEVMAAAEPVIRAAVPDANVPRSIRRSGLPVARRPLSELGSSLDAWLTENAEGVACVIGADAGIALPQKPRVRVLTPQLAKGLEFDLVALVDPDSWGSGIEGAVDRYVAMTRATQQLLIFSSTSSPTLTEHP